MASDSRYLPGVIGLNAAYRNQRVTAFFEGISDQVLQLSDLVASESDTRVAVFAFGPYLHVRAQALTEPGKRMNR